MGRANVLIPLLITELVLVFTAFGLGVALTAKEHNWGKNLDNVDPSVVSYVSVPGLTNYNTFVCIFGTVSLTILTLAFKSVNVSGFLIVHFLNFMFFLAAFILFTLNDITHADCTALSGWGDLYTSFCAIPKACEALDAVCWIMALTVLGIGWYLGDSDTFEDAEMTEANSAQKADV